MRSGEPFAVAAVWENWRDPATDEWKRTFAIITCPGNDLLSEIHDRMPVIIPRAGYVRWLANIEPDPRDLMVAFASDLMRIWPISARVNKPENDEPSILEPVVAAENETLL
jgi:putative SOS response-associated peptidase YedK